MRINHNIPALNSYRNLGTANTSNAKSMEKLSSGLRINRAADDAAGLAISETMRGQIKGLNQASRNSQDAISLLQTAEGGLTETNSILTRMRELSVQASNDTYTSNDRQEMQKEIDQLKDEIDRIANTTSFNNKNLLDGTASAITSSDKLTTKVIMRGGLRTVDQFGQKSSGGGSYKLDIAATAGNAQIQKSNIFKINQGGDSVQSLAIEAASGLDHVTATGLQYGTYGVKTTVNSFGGLAGFTYELQNYMTSTTKNANFFTTAAGNKANLVAGRTAGAWDSDYNGSMILEVTGTSANQLTVNVKAHLYTLDGREYNVNKTGVTLDMDAAAGAAIFQINAVDLDGIHNLVLASNGAALGHADASQYAVGDKTVLTLSAYRPIATNYDMVDTQFGYDGTGDIDPYGTAGKVVNRYVFNHDSLNNQTKDLKFYTLDTNQNSGTYGNAYDGKITLTTNGLSSSGGGTPVIPAASFTYGSGLGKVASLDTKLSDIDRFTDASGKFLLNDPQTITLVQGNGNKTSITLFNTDTIKDVEDKMNAAIRDGLGQGERVTATDARNFATYVTKATSGTSEAEEGTFVLRSAQAGKDGVINVIGNEQLINALGMSNIQNESESKFTINVTDATNGTAISSNVQISGNTLIGVVHENVDVKFDSNADINVAYNSTTKKFGLSGDAVNTYSTYIHLVDNSQVFQIGANEMQDMGAAIGSMGAEALSVNNILVTDRESAGRATSTIDAAISRVSAQRSSIGAVQNRLEHTINNLGVASENLTSAESRIRDVDMAAEMMEYSKTNILSQAATAMLAQANKQPQNVLQLLQ